MLTIQPMFTCPYCMGRYQKREVEFLCAANHVSNFSMIQLRKKRCQKPGCSLNATICRCPQCQESIPPEMLETPILPFSIVGVSNAGKTNYITMMLHELSRFKEIPLPLGAYTNETRRRQNERYQNLEKHKLPDNTESEIKPQLWFIKNLKKKGTYSITIFDGAGEDQERMDPSDPLCRYIGVSEAIILVLDPLTLPNVRRTVDPKILANSMGAARLRMDDTERNANDIVNVVARYIKNARAISVDRKLEIPVAVVLTKFDTILNHSAFPTQTLIREPSRIVRDGKFNTAELEQINSEIRTWLNDIGEANFLYALEANFKRFYCFGVSSFGCEPDQSNRLQTDPKPHRVLDPIMWLFHEKRFID